MKSDRVRIYRNLVFLKYIFRQLIFQSGSWYSKIFLSVHWCAAFWHFLKRLTYKIDLLDPIVEYDPISTRVSRRHGTFYITGSCLNVRILILLCIAFGGEKKEFGLHDLRVKWDHIWSRIGVLLTGIIQLRYHTANKRHGPQKCTNLTIEQRQRRRTVCFIRFTPSFKLTEIWHIMLLVFI